MVGLWCICLIIASVVVVHVAITKPPHAFKPFVAKMTSVSGEQNCTEQ